jgi:hypothetical protein
MTRGITNCKTKQLATAMAQTLPAIYAAFIFLDKVLNQRALISRRAA